MVSCPATSRKNSAPTTVSGEWPRRGRGRAAHGPARAGRALAQHRVVTPDHLGQGHLPVGSERGPEQFQRGPGELLDRPHLRAGQLHQPGQHQQRQVGGELGVEVDRLPGRQPARQARHPSPGPAGSATAAAPPGADGTPRRRWPGSPGGWGCRCWPGCAAAGTRAGPGSAAPGPGSGSPRPARSPGGTVRVGEYPPDQGVAGDHDVAHPGVVGDDRDARVHRLLPRPEQRGWGGDLGRRWRQGGTQGRLPPPTSGDALPGACPRPATRPTVGPVRGILGPRAAAAATGGGGWRGAAGWWRPC